MDPHFIRRNTRLTSLQIHPKMELHGKNLRCNGVGLNLGRKPLASKIVFAFMQDARQPLSKLALVRMITPSSLIKSMTTPRALRSREQSLARLLSRLRAEFKLKFQGVVPEGTHWFHFASHKNSWLLYKLPGEGPDGEFYS